MNDASMDGVGTGRMVVPWRPLPVFIVSDADNPQPPRARPHLVWKQDKRGYAGKPRGRLEVIGREKMVHAYAGYTWMTEVILVQFVINLRP